MKDILVAFGRAGRSLGRRDMFWHLLWPGLLAVVIWAGVAFYAWTPVTEWLYAAVSGWSFVGGWLSASETTAAIVLVLIQIATALLVVPLVYVTAAMLVATVALPLMLERVARTDYADLEQRRGGSNLGSAMNSIVAGVLFLLALVLSLPLWLIPGAGLLIRGGSLSGYRRRHQHGRVVTKGRALRHRAAAQPEGDDASAIAIGISRCAGQAGTPERTAEPGHDRDILYAVDAVGHRRGHHARTDGDGAQ